MNEQDLISNSGFRFTLEGFRPEVVKSVVLPAFRNGSWADMTVVFNVVSQENVTVSIVNMLKAGVPEKATFARLDSRQEEQDLIDISLSEIASVTLGSPNIASAEPSEIRVVFKVSDVLVKK